MPLTLGQLRQHVLLAVGGSPASAPSTAVVSATTPYQTGDQRVAEIINLAGQWMFSHNLGFLERQGVSVPVAADQEHADVPPECGVLKSIRVDDSWGAAVRIVSPDDLQTMLLAAPSVVGLWPRCAAIVRPPFTPGTAMPPRRLVLFPRPTQDCTLLLWYQARWVPIAHDTPDEHFMPVPDYAESPLIELVRMHAEGCEHDMLTQRLAAFKAGPVWRTMLAQDLAEHPVGQPSPAIAPTDPFSKFVIADPHP